MRGKQPWRNKSILCRGVGRLPKGRILNGQHCTQKIEKKLQIRHKVLELQASEGLLEPLRPLLQAAVPEEPLRPFLQAVVPEEPLRPHFQVAVPEEALQAVVLEELLLLLREIVPEESLQLLPQVAVPEELLLFLREILPEEPLLQHPELLLRRNPMIAAAKTPVSGDRLFQDLS